MVEIDGGGFDGEDKMGIVAVVVGWGVAMVVWVDDDCFCCGGG